MHVVSHSSGYLYVCEGRREMAGAGKGPQKTPGNGLGGSYLGVYSGKIYQAVNR